MLTDKERVVLNFLHMGRMEANVTQIGHELAKHQLCHGGYQAVGGGIVGILRRRGFIYFLDDLQAWRITKEGRAALAAHHNPGPNPVTA